MNENNMIVLLSVIIVIGVIISPLLFIWSLNTLFALQIAYGFFEWLAALIILSAVNRKNFIELKKNS